VSNHDKKYTPPKKAKRTSSAGADALARSDAQAKQPQLRGDVIPSPVPYDLDELGSGRGLTYEWEYWVHQLQSQINSLSSGGGGGSGAVTFVHTQGTAAAVWPITHSMNTKPNVLVVDNTGRQLICQVDYPSNNTVTLTHGSPYTGVAYLRA
jgi:hypothetical protein